MLTGSLAIGARGSSNSRRARGSVINRTRVEEEIVTGFDELFKHLEDGWGVAVDELEKDSFLIRRRTRLIQLARVVAEKVLCPSLSC
jgi:hypothetical protein